MPVPDQTDLRSWSMLAAAGLGATAAALAELPTELTMQQLRVLTVIAAAPAEISLSALAVMIGASLPSASRLCRRLVDEGLLRRRDRPRSTITLSLTPTGRRLLTKIDRSRAHALQEELSRLDSDALDELGRSLRSLSSAARARDVHRAL